MVSTFDSVDSIVNYLREPSPPLAGIITPSLMNSNINNNRLKSSGKQRKDKNLVNVKSTTPSPQVQFGGDVPISSKGRVRYGPITVNPRKQASKTLYTGRRSKYEVLSADEEEKRRERRDRNRVAATKCREKREHVLVRLENEEIHELEKNKNLLKMVNDLKQQKKDLESILTDHADHCLLVNNSSMIFGDTGFLSSITDTPAPTLPTLQQPFFYNDEEELSRILDPNPILTNSAYTTDDSNPLFLPEQQAITILTSSFERILNNLQTPISSMDQSTLVNSAIGSSCAKQHSHSSEEDSLPSTRTNPYVY